MTPSRSLLALALTASTASVAAADLPPVEPGLWEIQALTTFDPRPAQAPRPHSYRICIDGNRARAPMIPARLPGAGEVLIGRQALSGHYVQTGVDGRPQQVEFRYRRLGPTRFEGSYDRAAGGVALHGEYEARRLGADCGA
ncbi:MAG: hypothetical protein KGI36_17285, partial [Burkholderiales bacterium]|nr:hypothetical protein [Burkholderiales bacterium]